jgi:tight adherence protein C
MIAAIMAGAAVGLSLCFLAWALIPTRADNVAVLGRIEAARTARPWVSVQEPSVPTDRLGKLKALAGARVSGVLSRRGVEATTLRQDLAMVDREFEDFAGGSLVGFVVTFFGTLLAGSLMVAAGVHWIPPVSLFPAALGLAVVIAFARQHDVHKLAEERRREFRRGLSAYLDLVAMSVLGGTGLPEALPTAAAIGKGWPFRLLAETLDRARDMSGPLAAPTELGNLGRRIGISELRDLAAALSLTGEQGARIGKTLIDRAKTLRDRDTADVQGRAAERDSSLQVAEVGIGAGFLLFVVYPLVVSVLHL